MGSGTKQTSQTLLLIHGLVEWIELAAPGLVFSRVTLWVDAFEVQLIIALTGNLFMLS